MSPLENDDGKSSKKMVSPLNKGKLNVNRKKQLEQQIASKVSE